jgi:hypothetical protein
LNGNDERDDGGGHQEYAGRDFNLAELVGNETRRN